MNRMFLVLSILFFSQCNKPDSTSGNDSNLNSEKTESMDLKSNIQLTTETNRTEFSQWLSEGNSLSEENKSTYSTSIEFIRASSILSEDFKVKLERKTINLDGYGNFNVSDILFSYAEDNKVSKHLEEHTLASFDCDSIFDIKRISEKQLDYTTCLTMPNFDSEGVLYRKIIISIFYEKDKWKIGNILMGNYLEDGFECILIEESNNKLDLNLKIENCINNNISTLCQHFQRSSPADFIARPYSDLAGGLIIANSQKLKGFYLTEFSEMVQQFQQSTPALYAAGINVLTEVEAGIYQHAYTNTLQWMKELMQTSSFEKIEEGKNALGNTVVVFG